LANLPKIESAPDISTRNESTGRSFERVLLVGIALITFAAFLPVLQNGFVDWDERTLVRNVAHQGLGWAQLRWMFGSAYLGHYQPLAWLTFGLDHVLWWADPFGPHLTNVCIHAVNAVLLYLTGIELFAPRSSNERSRDLAWVRIAAGIAALGFALHPLRVEPVAWASARGELLGASFFLLSFFAYLKANAAVIDNTGSPRWSVVSIGAFLLSLLAGSNGLVLPIILLVIDVYPLRRLTGLSRGSWFEAARLLRQKLVYLLLSAGFFLVNLFAYKSDAIAPSIFRESQFNWIVNQLAAPAFYLWKALVPLGLSPAYELTGFSVAVYVAASLLLLLGVWAVRDRWPALVSVGICYLILLWPMFRSEFPTEQVLADRYTYLAGVPWALLVGLGVSHFRHSAPARRLGVQSLLWGSGIILLSFMVLAVLTWRQAYVWRDSMTLWRHAVAVRPSSRAYVNLARLSEAQGRFDDAIAANKRAAEIDPRRWDAHQSAARLLQEQGKIAGAVEHYQYVIRLKPDLIDARENLAAGLVNQGRIDEAVQHFRKALELAPERNGTRIKLGTVLAIEGRLAEASDVFTFAARADPDDGRILLQLGRVVAAQGDLAQAVHHFTKAARLRPEDAEVHESLGRALSELGNKDEAAKHLREALRILRSAPAAQ